MRGRLESAQATFQAHRDKYEKLRGDVAIKLKFLEENKVQTPPLGPLPTSPSVTLTGPIDGWENAAELRSGIFPWPPQPLDLSRSPSFQSLTLFC